MSEVDEATLAGTQEELDCMRKYHVFDVRPRSESEGFRREDTRWVHRRDEDGTVRARLVARQFRHKEEHDDLFSPCSSSLTNLIVDLIAVKRQWPTLTMDVRRAFFQATRAETCFAASPSRMVEKARW